MNTHRTTRVPASISPPPHPHTRFTPQLTVLVCHDQPSQAVMAMVDDLMVMAEGYVVYHGLPTDAVPFFEGRGFSMPADRDPVDFINMVLSPQFQPVR